MKDPSKQTKSDRTRAAILDAATRMFATEGYERTTIRDIGAAASIDPAMVIRYFHSKEELFARTAQLDLRLPDLRMVARDRIGQTLVQHFLSLWEGEGAHQGLAVMLRSAASNESALAKLQDVFAAQVLPALARAEGPLDAGDRAGLVASQLLGLAFCRYVIKLKPVVDLPHDLIVQELGRTLQSYIAGDR